MKFTVESIEDLEAVSFYVTKLMDNHRFFILNGDMGSGKTTLITKLANKLGIEDQTSSPTYSIVNEYLIPNGKKLFHFDLYRIKETGELFDMGIEEYFYSDNYCFVEWPMIAKELWPEEITEISIKIKDAKRSIEVKTIPAS